jgi:hypothetical protein
MPQRRKSGDVQVYQLKVTLKGSKPPIWRRLLVAGNTNLRKLHDILQTTMGWDGAHLHQFIVGGEYYGVPDPEYLEDLHDEKKCKLNQIVADEKSKFHYEYDFGDSWVHEIVVERILPPEPGKYYPVCITGKRSCPPEDVGGIWGYADFLETLKNPEDPDYEELLEWVGEDFDPEAFDLAGINRALTSIR